MHQFTDKQLNTQKEYLELLSTEFPCITSAASEVINLKAIMNLPKGTEHFLTDIHGEDEAFNHVMKNASGVIKRKISDVMGDTLSQHEIQELATLIYYPEEKLDLVKSKQQDINSWYRITIYRLIQVCREASLKYTRSKVRKALPIHFAYIMEELLQEDENRLNKKEYYNKIIETIIELDQSDVFIIQISSVIQMLTIDHLHIIGDIYDRGSGPHIVMDTLMKNHSMDIQWGNHDILWMGVAAGNLACIANAVRVCLRYGNMSILEDGYGINMLPLATFAIDVYRDDPCNNFLPKISEKDVVTEKDIRLLAKMHKTIAIIQFKIEHQLLLTHPEFDMDSRLFLDKIDYDNYHINIQGETYPLTTKHLPTINPDNPWQLTDEEVTIINKLKSSFLTSDKLQQHVRFLFSKGSIYLTYNSNLLFHASIPLNDDGSFKKIFFMDQYLSGKALLDELDKCTREAYFGNGNKQVNTDIFWYLWCHQDSPLFGKDKMATFERYFLNEDALHKETFTPYYTLVSEQKIAKKILMEFNLDPDESHIINGHVPVKTKDGESPIKANGKLLVIDGGFAKAYQSTTGIAGYTLIYNSYGLQLASHEPFESIDNAIKKGIDIRSTTRVIEKVVDRKRVADTDIGTKLNRQIYFLEMLICAYRKGVLKEKL